MAREKFEDRRVTGKFRVKLDRDDHSCGKYWEGDKQYVVSEIISVVNDYSKQGYCLTLRQVYYQLVSKNVIPNDDVAYGKLSSLLDDCRYSGLIDWNAIEDRGRVPYTPYFEYSVSDAIERTKDSYSLDKRQEQPVYIELWSEKDAISNILKQAVRDYTITVGINKGFTSSTAIYDAYNRFTSKILEEGKKVVVLYFGDHDPSGLDMVRDIRDRLEFMMSTGANAYYFRKKWDQMYEDGEVEDAEVDLISKHDDLRDKDREAYRNKEKGKEGNFSHLITAIVREFFEVRQIGLTREQVRKFNLPPNPAKITDPRAKKYIAKYGSISWEVDALRPMDIKDIITSSLEDLIDWDILANIKEREQEDKMELDSFIQKARGM